MALRYRFCLGIAGVASFFHLCTPIHALPLSVQHFASKATSDPETSPACSVAEAAPQPDAAPQLAMLQRRFKTVTAPSTSRRIHWKHLQKGKQAHGKRHKKKKPIKQIPATNKAFAAVTTFAAVQDKRTVDPSQLKTRGQARKQTLAVGPFEANRDWVRVKKGQAMNQTEKNDPVKESLEKSRDIETHAVAGQAMNETENNPSKESLEKSQDIETHAVAGPQADQEAVEGRVFRWGASSEEEHPHSIGKHLPHPAIQEYEATLPHLAGVVLNIFGESSNGDGGLLLALEVPSPCEKAGTWIEVDRTRCSSRYPCSLRVPGSAVASNEAPTRFRTRVVDEDEDYLTDYLEYKRVTLDHDAEVTIAHKQFPNAGDQPLAKRVLKFSLDPVLAAGALIVTPVLKGATPETAVTMRIRQPAGPELRPKKEKLSAEGSSTTGTRGKKKVAALSQLSESLGDRDAWGYEFVALRAGGQPNSPAVTAPLELTVEEEKEEAGGSHPRNNPRSLLEQSSHPRNQQKAALEQSEKLEDSAAEMKSLETTLQSYRASWAGQWREPIRGISGCDFSQFEVVADQLYPGDVEIEIWASGGNQTEISEVVVTTRVSWAEAEVKFLETILKDHFAYFNDPEVIVHGLPLDAFKEENPRRLPESNPTAWGYAMEAWVIMAETGVLKPDEAAVKLNESFKTLDMLQKDPEQVAHGLFYPYYELRNRDTGEKQFPKKTMLNEIPCGDDALLYASLMMTQGWLKINMFHSEADACAKIIGRMNFSHCARITDCNAATNGNTNADEAAKGDKFWSVPLTFNADTLEQSTYNWNVWADEGGIVAMIVALSGVVNETQYESIARQQQRYSPCSEWEGITVGHSAFFNSIFTLTTRSLLGFGTLFASPYCHEFAVRSVLPSFRAHQKLKKKLGIDYMGPSDAITVTPKEHPGKVYGSYAYWPPNNMYDCRKGVSTKQNQCTWCKGIQYEGLDDKFDLIVPHGNMASFLSMAMMEKSQFTAWLEDTKLLMTDSSEVYRQGYGLEVVAPAKRTPLGDKFGGAYDGRGVWEALSQGYTVLSMYEGLATMRRRYELAKAAGMKVRAYYEPPKYKPLSDFVNVLPKLRSKIETLLAVAREQESKERSCGPSHYGPAGHH